MNINMLQKLESLHIDVNKGIYMINGVDISKTATYLELIFENGVWSLTISENKTYISDEHDSTE